MTSILTLLQDHTWTADVSMISASDYASLAGTTTISFDTVTGRVMFPDLSFTGFGTFYLQFRVVSDPPDFNLTMNHKIPIKNPTHVGMTVEETYEVKVINIYLKNEIINLHAKHLMLLPFTT
jgi:hypothetical protein